MTKYKEIKDVLLQGNRMSEGEASAIAFMLFDSIGGLSKVDVLMDKEPAHYEAITSAAKRVAEGEPVQYVLGVAEFCGLHFHVEKGVLIPRVETEELVALAVEKHPKRVLDVGTGSGCIAVAVSKLSAGTKVTALDVSEEALSIARRNAESNGVEVEFQRCDILQEEVGGRYDMIVSNPPYICHCEAKDMESNVLDFEPHLALFVPDDDPLLFYRRIAEQGLQCLESGGTLLYEINRRFGAETATLHTGLGYAEVEVVKDQFGNDRMVKAIKP